MYNNLKGFYTQVVAPPAPTITLTEADTLFWVNRGYTAEQAAKIAAWVTINQMTPTPETIAELIKPAPAAYVYKILPPPDPIFKGKGLDLYKELDFYLAAGSVMDVYDVLKRGLNVEMSPIVFTAAIIAIGKVVAVIVSVVGSIGFAEFLMEEALQSIDQAIYSASREENWELEAKLLAKKKELLTRDFWETIIGLIPGVNVVAAAWKFFEASNLKYETDLELWKNKAAASGVNNNANLNEAAAAIQRGEDPSQFLPTASSDTIPEVITGTVTGVIDGDTIEVTNLSGFVYRIRLIGIDAPEFNTIAGKAAMTYLTDMIIHKSVEVKVDPNNKLDPYKRVLGVVFLNGVDVNLQMLKSGNAAYYVIGSSKYYSDAEYQAAVQKKGKVTITSKPTYCKIYVDMADTGLLTTQTLTLEVGTYIIGCAKEGYRAQSQTVTIEKDRTIEIRFELTATALGEPTAPPTEVPGEPSVTPPAEVPVTAPEEFKIYFTSSPSNAKLYIDDIYTHHWTPSNERELRDVIDLLSIGTHRVTVTKAGMMLEKSINVVAGDNGTHHFVLETVGLPPTAPAAPTPVTIDVAAKIAEIEKLLNELKTFVGL